MNKFTLTIASFAAAAAMALPMSAGADDRPRHRLLSAANALDLTTLTPINGASTLIRDRRGIRMTYDASGLEPGGTYTAWWVIFNRPDRCSDGVCSEDDVFVDPKPARTSVLYASGSLAGYDGIADFHAALDRRERTGEVLFGPGLVNVFGSEVHVVIRTHGQPIPGAVDLQLSTFNGGCETNLCADVQAAVHLPARRTDEDDD